MEHHECFDSLPPGFVRYADYRALMDLRKRHDRGLDLGAVNIETARNDHVFLVVHDIDVSVFVQVTHVASVMPAVAADFSRALRHFVIATTDKRPANNDFANLASGKNSAVIIHAGKSHGRSRFAATGETFRMLSGGSRGQRFTVEKSHQHRRLCLTIRLADAWPEHFHRLFQ